MSGINIRVSLFVLLCFVATACWQRQEHAILAPEIPHYTLSGYTIDIDDSLRVIPHTPISLTAFTMLYDVTFDPVSIQSDSSGYYQIDSVFPGNYILTAERNGYKVLSQPFTVYHANRFLNIELPKTWVESYSYNGIIGLHFTWTNRYLWGTAGDQINLGRISGGTVERIGTLPNPVPDVDGMDYHNGIVYMFKYAHVHLLSPVNASLITDWVADEPLNSLAWADSGYWTTHGNFLQYRGENLKTVELSYETSASRLQSLNISGVYLWAYDWVRGLVLKMDDRGNIIASYALIDSEKGSQFGFFDMEFHIEGLLYVAGGKKLYLFLTDEL